MHAVENAQAIKSIVVGSGQPFRYSVAYAFLSDSPIVYSLESTSPTWLKINAEQGVISGQAPKIQTEHEQFFVTVLKTTQNLNQQNNAEILCKNDYALSF